MKHSIVTVDIEREHPEYRRFEVDVAITEDEGVTGGPPDGWVEPSLDAEIKDVHPYDENDEGTADEMTDAEMDRAVEKAIREYQT